MLYQNAARIGSSKKKCQRCGSRASGPVQRCLRCLSSDLANLTLGELREQSGQALYHNRLRSHARTAYKGPKRCEACGYDLHFDVCHIRPIANFPSTATVGEVNHPENLTALDKRCHWEFDHGHLVRAVEGDGTVRWSRVTAPG